MMQEEDVRPPNANHMLIVLALLTMDVNFAFYYYHFHRGGSFEYPQHICFG